MIIVWGKATSLEKAFTAKVAKDGKENKGQKGYCLYDQLVGFRLPFDFPFDSLGVLGGSIVGFRINVDGLCMNPDIQRCPVLVEGDRVRNLTMMRRDLQFHVESET